MEMLEIEKLAVRVYSTRNFRSARSLGCTTKVTQSEHAKRITQSTQRIGLYKTPFSSSFFFFPLSKLPPFGYFFTANSLLSPSYKSNPGVDNSGRRHSFIIQTVGVIYQNKETPFAIAAKYHAPQSGVTRIYLWAYEAIDWSERLVQGVKLVTTDHREY